MAEIIAALGWTLVARQVVHHDDVAVPQGRREDLFDVRERARAHQSARRTPPPATPAAPLSADRRGLKK